MSRRKRCIIICALFLVAIAFWALLSIMSPANDEEKYQQYVHYEHVGISLSVLSKRWPVAFRKPLNPLFHYLGHAVFADEKQLLDSGYLTNLTVILTNATNAYGNTNKTPTIDEISKVLKAAVPNNDLLPAELVNDLENRQVTVMVTCRTNDIPFLKKALEVY